MTEQGAQTSFDFTSYTERKGSSCYAVDSPGMGPGVPGAPDPGFDVIPMWVADMSFPVFPGITDAVRERMAHPFFGYFFLRDAWYDAILSWHAARYGTQGLARDMLGYENGVLGGVASALEAFCGEGSREVLVHSPTYIGFRNLLKNAGFTIVESPLARDADGVWRMDLADMEEKLSRGTVSAAILCSPQNPCGRVWTREELEAAYEVFARYDVGVVSDEIWSDIVLDGNRHIPSIAVSEDARMRTAAFYAPSKTFNLAGLVGSYHVIPDPDLRSRVERISRATDYNNLNVLSVEALIGAYTPEGARWTDELRKVLSTNVTRMCGYLRAACPEAVFSSPEGTYMLFLDMERYCEKKGMTIDALLHSGWRVGVTWQDGRPFGGTHTIRMNLALPPVRLEEAIRRMEKYVFT